VVADAGVVCDKDVMLVAVIKDTVCMSMMWKLMMAADVGYIL
jgi:hypothetical protein